MKTSPRRLLWQPLAAALAGALFCFWMTLDSESLCVTTGCALFQDASVGGVSLWHYGMAAFMLLSVLAVSGFGAAGRLASGCCLLGDVLLLALMAATAPCASCLIVALFFALTYGAFRREARPRESRGKTPSASWLLWAWALLWAINILAAGRNALGPWVMQGDPEQAGIHLYFSPSCPSCIKALKVLSGNIGAAFYPVAETDGDVAAVLRMEQLRRAGSTLYEAQQQAMQEAPELSLWRQWAPEVALLRFRMLRNKAHVLAAGGRAVPYIEYRGLPAHIAQKADAEEMARLRREAAEALRDAGATPRFTPRGREAREDVRIPVDLEGISGSCGGSAPCPE
ncbi:MAG: hypothetical protein PUB01_03395 [Desulfovibrionaceae bacterium]|nr:hypothetical protein [Desulfovibrionaceae bacterium]